MADYPKIASQVAAVAFALVFVSVLIIAFAPQLIGDNGLVSAIFPIATMLLVLFASLAAFASMLLILHEIVTAKNERNWKILWGIAVFIFGIVGVGLYFVRGRKERKKANKP